MSTWALMAVTFLYILTAYDLFHKGNWPLGIAFIAYAVANVGFIAAALQSKG